MTLVEHPNRSHSYYPAVPLDRSCKSLRVEARVHGFIFKLVYNKPSLRGSFPQLLSKGHPIPPIPSPTRISPKCLPRYPAIYIPYILSLYRTQAFGPVPDDCCAGLREARPLLRNASLRSITCICTCPASTRNLCLIQMKSFLLQ